MKHVVMMIGQRLVMDKDADNALLLSPSPPLFLSSPPLPPSRLLSPQVLQMQCNIEPVEEGAKHHVRA